MEHSIEKAFDAAVGRLKKGDVPYEVLEGFYTATGFGKDEVSCMVLQTTPRDAGKEQVVKVMAGFGTVTPRLQKIYAKPASALT